MLTRMTRMARMLIHMLTRMTRWLAGSHIIHTQSEVVGSVAHAQEFWVFRGHFVITKYVSSEMSLE